MTSKRPHEFAVVDEPDAERFAVHVDGATGELTYALHGKRLYLRHTGVPDEIEGRGIGGRLVRAALERARAEHLTLVPWCPFARSWLERHPSETAGVEIDYDTPRP